MKKEKIIILGELVLILGLVVGLIFSLNMKKEKPLPKTELAEGLRGVYGIDKNINESTIDNYLGRSDTVYRDLRMLVDSATWENKGGDRYLSGFIKGFEVVPYPYIAGFTEDYLKQKESENVSGLYTGKTLFSLNADGTYTANYEESMDILEYLFPKDKNIILMCGAGGYAGIAKKMLISLGWDENKIYDIGGYWYYNGNNKIEVKETIDGKTTYDFSKVAYHDIDFSVLHKIK
jgi:rhodanese-related sulfurtransferase